MTAADAERLAVIQANVFAVLRAETYDGGFGYLSPDQFSATCNQAADKVIKVVIAPIVAERDVLRARIDAAPHERWCTPSKRLSFGCKCWKSKILAGDQPEATPEPVRCAQCGGKISQQHNGRWVHVTYETNHDDPATPEPPHLDPKPYYIEEIGYPPEADEGRYSVEDWLAFPDESTVANLAEFRPRPADENGKPYSKNIDHYKKEI